MTISISYEKNYQGAWVLTTIANNRLYSKAYYFYTKKEATALFREYVQGGN
jgi:hypothetical protein